MAAHISFDDQINHGRQLRRMLQQMEESHRALIDLLATIGWMIENDGSTDTDFSYVAKKFGFPDDATAREAINQLRTLDGKFSDYAGMQTIWSKFG